MYDCIHRDTYIIEIYKVSHCDMKKSIGKRIKDKYYLEFTYPNHRAWKHNRHFKVN